MEEKQDIYLFREIVDSGNPIILDTSSLSFSKDNNCPIELQMDFLEKELLFFPILKEYLFNGGDFYFTSSVKEEIDNSNYQYKKIVKRGDNKGERQILELRRKRKQVIKERRSLANLFQDRGRVFSLNDMVRVPYNLSYRKHSYLRDIFNLGGAKFDLLIWALILSKERGSVSVLSNHYSMNNAREKMLCGENMGFNRLSFFFRRGMDKFEKLRPY